MAATCRESHSPKKPGKASRPQRLQLEDAENVPSPPISPGQAGSGGPRAANPAAFLRNTNSMFSPDVPAEAGLHCTAGLLAGSSQPAWHLTACHLVSN